MADAGGAQGGSSLDTGFPEVFLQQRAPAFLPPRTSAGAPAVDDLAMLCLLLDAAGAIRWANETAIRLLREVCTPKATAATLMNLVHRDEYHGVETLLKQTREDHHRVESVVRLADSGGQDEQRHAHLVLSPHAATAQGYERAGAEVIVQGWDVSPLILRMRELQVPRPPRPADRPRQPDDLHGPAPP